MIHSMAGTAFHLQELRDALTGEYTDTICIFWVATIGQYYT